MIIKTWVRWCAWNWSAVDCCNTLTRMREILGNCCPRRPDEGHGCRSVTCSATCHCGESVHKKGADGHNLMFLRHRPRTAFKLQHCLLPRQVSQQMDTSSFGAAPPTQVPNSTQVPVQLSLAKDTKHTVNGHCHTASDAHVIHAVDDDNSGTARKRRRRIRRTRWLLTRTSIERWSHGRDWRANTQICQALGHLHTGVVGGPPTSSPAAPRVCPHSSSPAPRPPPPRRSVGGPPPLLSVPWVGPHHSTPAPAACFRVFFHRTISQFDLPCQCCWRCQSADEMCQRCWWIQSALGIPVKTFVIDGGSMRPRKKGLGILAASWLPVVGKVKPWQMGCRLVCSVLWMEVRCGLWCHGHQMRKERPWQLGSRLVLSV